ncbi:MAG: LysR family transcriptional regulator [Firmicutes bacterium]|jgi:DNA-binding transcriptional LysR family regulator|nr:LysR family transcriptional regulator [Bacillota bacterium]
MEIRVLKYFITIAREQNISAAAEKLHLSQPTLSRQIKDMEDELGKQLFIRGNRKITLTEDGMILRKRAEEILDLVQKAENEIAVSDKLISGEIIIGTGEVDGVRIVAKTAKKLSEQYPNIQYNIISGDSVDIIEKLDKGLIDFAVLVGYAIDISKYDSVKLPNKETWGVLMKNDCVLAQKEYVTAQDLWDKSLIVSRQAIKGKILTDWLEKDISQLNIIAYYNLVYNASLMVEEGLGYALCIDKIINITEDSNICFKPFYPNLEVGMDIVWKKYQVFSRASQKFLEALKQML